MQARSPETLYICPLDAIDDIATRIRPGHMISLINEEAMRALITPEGVPPARHLRLAMNDIATPKHGHIAPAPEHVTALVDFMMSWDRNAPVLINCLAGVSRSTAAAFTILCALNPQADEADVARLLHEASPTAQPNRLLVGHADRLLDRDGRMIGAAHDIAARARPEPARPFALPARIHVKA
jgi:predicted protein tyrosine phosphatase